MVNVRNPFKRQDSVSGAVDPSTLTASRSAEEHRIATPEYEKDEKDANGFDTKAHAVDGPHLAPGEGFMDHVEEKDVLANGKERPIETAEDIATRCISLEDDPSLPIHTFRMYFLGLGLTCFAAVLGQIFYFRPQTVYVSQLFLQIIAFILGKAWETALPNASRGKVWAFLNPGVFNIKEHVAILIMSSTASSSAEAISVFAADELYYNITPNYAICIFTLMASQLFGFGIAGLMRAFCVFPTYIVYPNLVPTVNLFDALHRDKNVENQKKRLRFFWIVFGAIFFWQWIPEFIAPTLTGISIFCLARRDSAWVTRIFGGSNGNEGLGMFSLCLDWNYIGSGGGSLGALFTPMTTQISQYIGVGLCCILFTTMYYTNAWGAQAFPFLSQKLFYANGSSYDQTTILNADYSLNEAALDIQGLPRYAPSNAIYYLGCNLAIGATLTHVGIWYWKPILNAIKGFRDRSIPDPHYQAMRRYKEVPMYVYGAIMLVSFAMAMATCYTGHSQLPWWALIVAFVLSIFMFPFVCVIYAITGFKTDVQQLAQMLGAALVPGNSQANMYFTLYGYNSTAQGLALARDLKMAQYTKLPPRTTLWAQSLGTVVGAILQLVIMKSVISSQRELLLDTQGSNIWSGQQVQSFNSQAIAWGALAKHMYGPGSTYFIIPISIVIGLFVPIPFYFMHRLWPKMGFNTLVTPIVCWCLGYLSVGINSSVFTTMLLAIFSQFYLRKYASTWFRKYNYLASAALDGGTQFMVFIATFALFGAAGNAVTMPEWALNPSGNLDYCLRLT